MRTVDGLYINLHEAGLINYSTMHHHLDDKKMIFESWHLEIEPEYYLTIARKAKGKQEWYIGNVNGNESRVSNIGFDFLEPNKTYIATIYADAKDAHYLKKPKPIPSEKYW